MASNVLENARVSSNVLQCPRMSGRAVGHGRHGGTQHVSQCSNEHRCFRPPLYNEHGFIIEAKSVPRSLAWNLLRAKRAELL